MCSTSGSIPERRAVGASLCALLLGAAPWLAAAAQEAAPTPPQIEEQVQVELVELRLLVTDERGRPIADLEAEEVEVYEGGELQRIAFLEHVAEASGATTREERLPPPAPLYTPQGERVVSPEPEAVAPPKPIRRIVFAFDVKNSKKNVREEWTRAALDWIRTEMRSEDRAAIVVFRNYPDWLTPLTSDRELLQRTLQALALESGISDRDRRRDVARLVDDLVTLCTDLSRGGPRGPRGRQLGTAVSGEEERCAYRVVEPYVYQWNRDAQESAEVLRTLTGQLAAVPGRKMVLLFSEGIVPDATSVGVEAAVAVFGAQRIDHSLWRFNLDRDITTELSELHRVARAADVAFFALDTRQGYDAGMAGMAEQPSNLSNVSLGMNPWRDMEWSMRDTLSALARETGGRYYSGRKDVGEHVRLAADSWKAFYLLGYYRSRPGTPLDKVTVKLKRKRVEVDYARRPDRKPHQPLPLKLDLTIGAPEPSGDGDGQYVPVAVLAPLESLPLRREGLTYGCQLGLFLQAVRPDGTVAAERLEMPVVELTSREQREIQGKLYQHRTRIELPPGAFRLRARLSDDRQAVLGERALDFTLLPGGEVRAGLDGGFLSSPASGSDQP